MRVASRAGEMASRVGCVGAPANVAAFRRAAEASGVATVVASASPARQGCGVVRVLLAAYAACPFPDGFAAADGARDG